MITINYIRIDADACPRQVLAITQSVCAEKGWQCITYASFNHQLTGPNHIVVDAEPEAVDLKLTNDTQAGEIVITQDTGVAAMVLGKRAKALSPHGHIFRRETIEFQLEARHEKARARREGWRTKGPAARTTEDDRRFEQALRSLMERE